MEVKFCISNVFILERLGHCPIPKGDHALLACKLCKVDDGLADVDLYQYQVVNGTAISLPAAHNGVSAHQSAILPSQRTARQGGSEPVRVSCRLASTIETKIEELARRSQGR